MTSRSRILTEHSLNLLLLLLIELPSKTAQGVMIDGLEDLLDLLIGLLLTDVLLLIYLRKRAQNWPKVLTSCSQQACVLLQDQVHYYLVDLLGLFLILLDWQFAHHQFPSWHIWWALSTTIPGQCQHRCHCVFKSHSPLLVLLLWRWACQNHVETLERLGCCLCERRDGRSQVNGIRCCSPCICVRVAKGIKKHSHERWPDRTRCRLQMLQEIASKIKTEDFGSLVRQPCCHLRSAVCQNCSKMLWCNFHHRAKGLLVIPAAILFQSQEIFFGFLIILVVLQFRWCSFILFGAILYMLLGSRQGVVNQLEDLCHQLQSLIGTQTTLAYVLQAICNATSCST
mmetsp:Transcript_6709/g.11526  ORF Transcript_6709/g.11526 Transcript_6709/m.11526 type:complete len:341 (+) Transcript_6709:118-1140(+)